MNKKKILIVFLLFISLFLSFFVSKTLSKYTKNIKNSIVLNVVEVEEFAYLKNYNIDSDFLGFDKTNITSFSRNTSLSKNDVLAKDGVKLISNADDDGYLSSYEIYGWIEDNNFYCWSEANIIYFHPNTKKAFQDMTNLVTIDFTGISTSKVKIFYWWFGRDVSLTTINGKINTSGLSKNGSFYYMFYSCKELLEIDTSEFYTANASDMGGMFYQCYKLRAIDVSHFDTSNVKNFFGMFSLCRCITELDVSNFNTSNATRFSSMFSHCWELKKLDISNFDTSKGVEFDYMFFGLHELKYLDVSSFDTRLMTTSLTLFRDLQKVEVIVLGNNFLTSNISNMDYMFANNTNLKVIYVKNDFNVLNVISSVDMFMGDNKLVGGYLTNNQTLYNSNIVDYTYAKVSNANQSGYFTYYNSIDDIKYGINYNLNGGTLTENNRDYYYVGFNNFLLNNPHKKGYKFIGWTGSNGNIPELNVVVDGDSTGDKNYVANYIEGDEFFIPGPCIFTNGSLVTGDNCKITNGDDTIQSFTNDSYINSNISLYNQDNYNRDYEISFVINDWIKNISQETVMNSKYENSTEGYPGITFRRATTKDYLELSQTIKNNKSTKSITYKNNMRIKIVRINKNIYYQINDDGIISFHDLTNLIQYFDTPVWFGAASTSTNSMQRPFTGTLSNITVRLSN